MIQNAKLLLTSLFLFTLITYLGAKSVSIVSWNIQYFGKTKDAAEIKAIAQIVRDFDIVLIQEVVAIDPSGARKVGELAETLKRMGSNWDYRVSHFTDSPGKRKERYAILWKSSKVKLIGRPWLDKSCEPVMYREPYLARFRIKEANFLIANYHSRSYRENPQEEIPCFYDYQDRFNEDHIVIAGDWNAFTDDPIFNILWKKGFRSNVYKVKTTLKRSCGTNGAYKSNPIDFILYEERELQSKNAGVLDFVQDCEKLTLARRLSDHLPVWIEFEL